MFRSPLNVHPPQAHPNRPGRDNNDTVPIFVEFNGGFNDEGEDG